MHKAVLDRSAGSAVQIVAESGKRANLPFPSPAPALAPNPCALPKQCGGRVAQSASPGLTQQPLHQLRLRPRANPEGRGAPESACIDTIFKAINFSIYNSKCLLLPQAKRTEKSSSLWRPAISRTSRRNSGTTGNGSSRIASPPWRSSSSISPSPMMSGPVCFFPATNSRSPSRHISSI